MEGLESGMQDIAVALTGLGDKVERLAELSVDVQRTVTSTAAAVQVCVLSHADHPSLPWPSLPMST